MGWGKQGGVVLSSLSLSLPPLHDGLSCAAWRGLREKLSARLARRGVGVLYTEWQERKRWADVSMGQARKILHRHLGRGRIRSATWAEDATQATDLVMIRPGKRPVKVAWRTRRAVYYNVFKDVTIRSAGAMGFESELSKLRRGIVHFMLVMWCNDDGAVSHFVLWNVRRAARQGLFDVKRETIQNEGYNASSFMAIPLRELRECGAVVAEGH